ncbi:MAG: hypothetical protein ACTSWY_12340 [Promethearchaeota archaeon]
MAEIKEIGKQLKESLQADVAIIDKYGFILSSYIKNFKTGTIISPTLLDFFNAREKVSKELNTKEINSIVVSISDTNLVFTFGEKLILMSKLPKKIDLDEYLPSIKRFLVMIDKATQKKEQSSFKDLNISNEIEQINKRLSTLGKNRVGKFKIFGNIIKKMNEI